MTPLQRLLLIPCLSPLLLTLLVGGLNLGKSGSLRILTWELPALPIGVWMTVAATTGAVLGSGGALTAVSGSTRRPLQREVRRPYGGTAQTTPHEEEFQTFGKKAPMSWPERDVRDPAPTVSVPFRVIRTGPKATKDDSAKVDVASNAASAQEVSKAEVSKAVDTIDWDQPLSDDW